MKKSELLETIEEIITEILGEATPAELKQETLTISNRTAEIAELNKQLSLEKDPKKQVELKARLEVLKTELSQAQAIKETEDEDEFDTLDDTASDKESNKSAKEEEKKNKKINKKRDEIISAYKKIAGDIKAKAKAANSGDKEAKAWILKHQDTIKAYNKLKN